MSDNYYRLAAFVLLAVPALAQSTTRPKYMDHAAIDHARGLATVTAFYPTPLYQAVEGIRHEFGWQVNWEEAPCYSHFDTVDDSSPRWRAAHPDAEGVTRGAGGRFSSTFPEPRAGEVATQEPTLRKVIEDYNATENPGKYVLRSGPGKPFTVIGTEVRDDAGNLKEITPILDTPISITAQQRSAYETLDAILKALSSAVGKRIILMSLPNNLLIQTRASLQGSNIPARQLLQELFSATQRPLQYDLGFDPDHSGVYILNVSVAAKAPPDR
jgi:hypothetical protein